jgi:hypothetical protein
MTTGATTRAGATTTRTDYSNNKMVQWQKHSLNYQLHLQQREPETSRAYSPSTH